MEHNPAKGSLSEHILPNSSMMIGVCMTVISIIKVMGFSHDRHQIAEILAVDSLLFMISAIFSYVSMRIEPIRNPHSAIAMERIADIAFMIGLGVTTLVGFLLAYEIF